MAKVKYDKQVVAERIKTERTLLGWTQKELSEKSGISVASIKLYETARRIPDNYNLNCLSDTLKVKPEYLLGETPYKNYFHQLDLEHPETVIKLRSEVHFLEYCSYIGCDFQDFTEKQFEKFMSETTHLLLNCCKKINLENN